MESADCAALIESASSVSSGLPLLQDIRATLPTNEAIKRNFFIIIYLFFSGYEAIMSIFISVVEW
jgi:hypothetical protein